MYAGTVLVQLTGVRASHPRRGWEEIETVGACVPLFIGILPSTSASSALKAPEAPTTPTRSKYVSDVYPL
jgi:hypothetical protein